MSDEVSINSEIADLISQITLLSKRNDPLISIIKSPSLLIRGLTELKGLVEMVDIKREIVRQIKFLITNMSRKNVTTASFEGHMLHTVISGDPGTGKTTVAKILAKIWMSLGLIKSDSGTVIPIHTTNYELKINNLHKLLSSTQELTCDIRRSLCNLNNLDNIDKLKSQVRRLRFELDQAVKESNIQQKKKPETIDPYENCDPKFIIADRADLVAEYLGQTAPKTKKVLEKARGGVLFIDEAYSLSCNENGQNDKFGDECLTTINEFMSNNPNEIIVIFAGYKDKLLNTIFKVQPGLMRRCSYFFSIEKYTIDGLDKIFRQQIAKEGWILDPDVKLNNIINTVSNNEKIFEYGGGFTEKLALFCKLVYGEEKFNDTLIGNNTSNDSIITKSIVKKAFSTLQENATYNKETDNKETNPPVSMFI